MHWDIHKYVCVRKHGKNKYIHSGYIDQKGTTCSKRHPTLADRTDGIAHWLSNKTIADYGLALSVIVTQRSLTFLNAYAHTYIFCGKINIFWGSL